LPILFCVSVLVWPIQLTRSIDTGIGNTVKGISYSILYSNTFFGAHFEMMLFLQTPDIRRKKKGKGKEVDLYSAYRQYNSTTKRSDVDHTELPAHTPHLPFLRIRIR